MDRYDLRRLEKAARQKDKKYLIEWGSQFEEYINETYRKKYNKVYKEELQNSIDNIFTAIAYTLYFSEHTNFNKEQLPDFMEDLFVTIDMFRTGEYKPQEYSDILSKEGVQIEVYDYFKLYEDRIKKLDELIDRYTSKLDNKNNHNSN